MKQLFFLLIAVFTLFSACEADIEQDIEEVVQEAALKSTTAESFDFYFYDHEAGYSQGGNLPLYFWDTEVPDPPGKYLWNQTPDWRSYESYVTEDNGVFTGHSLFDANNDLCFVMNWGHSFTVDQDYIYSFWYKMELQNTAQFSANNLAGGDYINPYTDNTGGDGEWTNVVLTGYPNQYDQAHVYFYVNENQYFSGLQGDSYCLIDSIILLPQEPIITVGEPTWNELLEVWIYEVSVPDYFEDYGWDDDGGTEYFGENYFDDSKAVYHVDPGDTFTIENRIKYDGVWYGWHDVERTAPALVYESDWSTDVDGWGAYWQDGDGTLTATDDELVVDMTVYITGNYRLRPYLYRNNTLTSGETYTFMISGTGELAGLKYTVAGPTWDNIDPDYDLTDGTWISEKKVASNTCLWLYFDGRAVPDFELTKIRVFEH